MKLQEEIFFLTAVAHRSLIDGGVRGGTVVLHKKKEEKETKKKTHGLRLQV